MTNEKDEKGREVVRSVRLYSDLEDWIKRTHPHILANFSYWANLALARMTAFQRLEELAKRKRK